MNTGTISEATSRQGPLYQELGSQERDLLGGEWAEGCQESSEQLAEPRAGRPGHPHRRAHDGSTDGTWR